jgi:hypothetical protein
VKSKSITSTVAASLAVLGVAGGGYLLGTNGNGSASAASTSTTQQGPGEAGHAGKHDGDRAQELTALANKLGVSKSKLQAAMQKVRGQNAGGRHAGQQARENAEAQALATGLGVDANKVSAALAKAEATEHSTGKSGQGEGSPGQVACSRAVQARAEAPAVGGQPGQGARPPRPTGQQRSSCIGAWPLTA